MKRIILISIILAQSVFASHLLTTEMSQEIDFLEFGYIEDNEGEKIVFNIPISLTLSLFLPTPNNSIELTNQYLAQTITDERHNHLISCNPSSQSNNLVCEDDDTDKLYPPHHGDTEFYYSIFEFSESAFNYIFHANQFCQDYRNAHPEYDDFGSLVPYFFEDTSFSSVEPVDGTEESGVLPFLKGSHAEPEYIIDSPILFYCAYKIKIVDS